MLAPRARNGSLSEETISFLIEKDGAAGKIVADRGGKISRRHYAEVLGVVSSAMYRFVSVFEKYEKKYSIATGPLRMLPEMRKYLEDHYEQRKLRLRNGKIDRSEFAKNFSLRGGSFLTKYPEIRSLFDEYDAKVKREKYLPETTAEDVERLSEALAKDIVLNKDRTTINFSQLSKDTKIPQNTLAQEPFVSLIAAKQAQIIEVAQQGVIDPFLHGRVYSFSELMPLWPIDFLRRVGARFQQVALGWSATSAKQPYLALIRALRWLGVSENEHCRAAVASAAQNGRIVADEHWEEALFALRDHLVALIATGERTKSSVDNEITALRRSLEGLTSGGLVPKCSMPLPGVKYSRRLQGHLRSVAEVGHSKSNQNVDAYVAFASEVFKDASRSFGLDMGMGDASDFLGGLASELSVVSDLPTDPSEAIRHVLRRRLEVLKNRAAEIFGSAEYSLETGRELVSTADIDSEAFASAYTSSDLSDHQRRVITGLNFPNPDCSPEHEVQRGLGNLLQFINMKFEGVPPKGAANGALGYGQFFAKRYLNYGGLKQIAPMLNPEPDAVGAVLTLYLIESGANISVGRTLDRDCIEASERAGLKRITGHKARAKGKAIIVDLPDDSLSIRGIEWLLGANSRLRVHASDDADRLFLMRIGARVQLMTPHWYTNWFKLFAQTSGGLQHLHLTPNMIRPSVLLLAALENDGRLAAGIAIGQHTTSVSQGYQQKWPTRLLYDKNIQRFQRSLETLVLSNIPEAAKQLGISEDEFRTRLAKLQRTGLGTFCRDHLAHARQPGQACEQFDCWDCSNSLIVADVEAIAELRLWKSALVAVQPEWERDRPERWEELWLPWLCMCEVVEQKMVRGDLIRTWKAAGARAREISALPGYVPPTPW